jgi:hypothetical protein
LKGRGPRRCVRGLAANRALTSHCGIFSHPSKLDTLKDADEKTEKKSTTQDRN